MGRTESRSTDCRGTCDCFTMALSGQLGSAGLRADKLETTATVSCEKLEAGWTVTQSHLYVKGTAPKADAAAWEKAAEAAMSAAPFRSY